MISAVTMQWQLVVTKIGLFLHCADDFGKKHHMLLIWCLGIFYKFMLDVLYTWAASPQYSYAGLVYAPGSVKYILGLVLYVVLFAALPKKEHQIGAFLLHLQFVFTVAPMLTFYALADGSTQYILMVFICILLQTWIVRRPVGQSGAIHIRGIQNYVTVALGILVIFSAVIPILYNGFAGLEAFDFEYIYVMRENATYPPAFSYLLGWCTNTILPFACLVFLTQKKYRLLIVCVVLQVLFYMETGAKFTLFILVPIFFIYFIAKSGHLLKLLYGGLILLFFGSVILFQLDRVAPGLPMGVLLNSIIGIRAIFHPADNKFNYFEYFSDHPKVFFSDGIFGKMFSLTYPYAGSIGQVSYASNGGEFLSANMNTGYLGEAYAQMGFLGILLMACLLGVIIRGLHAYMNKQNFAILAGLFSVYMIILNDGALFATLLTGGMLVAFLLVFVYFNRHEKENYRGIQCL